MDINLTQTQQGGEVSGLKDQIRVRDKQIQKLTASTQEMARQLGTVKSSEQLKEENKRLHESIKFKDFEISQAKTIIETLTQAKEHESSSSTRPIQGDGSLPRSQNFLEVKVEDRTPMGAPPADCRPRSETSGQECNPRLPPRSVSWPEYSEAKMPAPGNGGRKRSLLSRQSQSHPSTEKYDTSFSSTANPYVKVESYAPAATKVEEENCVPVTPSVSSAVRTTFKFWGSETSEERHRLPDPPSRPRPQENETRSSTLQPPVQRGSLSSTGSRSSVLTEPRTVHGVPFRSSKRSRFRQVAQKFHYEISRTNTRLQASFVLDWPVGVSHESLKDFSVLIREASDNSSAIEMGAELLSLLLKSDSNLRTEIIEAHLPFVEAFVQQHLPLATQELLIHYFARSSAIFPETTWREVFQPLFVSPALLWHLRNETPCVHLLLEEILKVQVAESFHCLVRRDAFRQGLRCLFDQVRLTPDSVDKIRTRINALSCFAVILRRHCNILNFKPVSDADNLLQTIVLLTHQEFLNQMLARDCSIIQGVRVDADLKKARNNLLVLGVRWIVLAGEIVFGDGETDGSAFNIGCYWHLLHGIVSFFNERCCPELEEIEAELDALQDIAERSRPADGAYQKECRKCAD